MLRPRALRMLAALAAMAALAACAGTQQRPAKNASDDGKRAATRGADAKGYRFDMTQNGRKMSAEDFDAWMKANGLRVAKGKPAPPARPKATATAKPAAKPAAGPTATAKPAAGAKARRATGKVAAAPVAKKPARD